MKTPSPRGDLSSWLATTLRGDREPVTWPVPGPATVPAWQDDDLQLALWCCYELHYRGFDDVSDDWEWSPGILAFRAALERPWIAALRDLSAVPEGATLRDVVDNAPDVGMAKYLRRHATREQFREFVLHRSIYQLKEADPHSFGIPRATGRTKAALVEIQADEYGGGIPHRMHSELFRGTMRWLGLDDEYGAYVESVPAVTLASSNAMSFFGLHRRWLGALLGHLAALEMTSTLPNRRYAAGLRRLGADDDAVRYFDEHVEADAVHEQIAANDLCGNYMREHPDRARDVLSGAACCLELDAMVSRHLLDSWEEGVPSVLPAMGLAS